jgi:hypothetical protein
MQRSAILIAVFLVTNVASAEEAELGRENEFLENILLPYKNMMSSFVIGAWSLVGVGVPSDSAVEAERLTRTTAWRRVFISATPRYGLLCNVLTSSDFRNTGDYSRLQMHYIDWRSENPKVKNERPLTVGFVVREITLDPDTKDLRVTEDPRFGTRSACYRYSQRDGWRLTRDRELDSRFKAFLCIDPGSSDNFLKARPENRDRR